MDYKKLEKPTHLRDEVWRQHLRWLDVVGKQVDANYRQHWARVKEDAKKSRALWNLHQEVMHAPHRTLSLFCKRVD